MANPNSYYPRVNFKPEPNVFEFMRKRCIDFWNEVAVIDAETGREWTFASVLSRVCQLRDFLRRNGVCTGDRVAVYAFNSLESYASVWALASLPAQVVLIRPIFKYREVSSILEISKCPVVITDRAHLNTVLGIQRAVSSLQTILLTDDSDTPIPSIAKLFMTSPDAFSYPDPETHDHSDDTAFMIPTSGTAGNSKLVEHTHRSFLSSFYVTAPHVRMLHNHDVVLMSSSISHVTGLWALGGCMHQGIKCVVPRLASLPTFELFRDTCDRFKVSTFLTFPTVFRNILLTATGNPVASVTNIMCGGSRSPPGLGELLRRWFPNLCHVRQLLGQTEVMVYVSITPENETDLQTIGHPPSNCAIRIQNMDTGEENGAGEIGEIVVQSPCLMKGYFQNPDETRAAFTEDGWMRTGDLGYLDPERRRFCFVNRIQEVITCKDNRLYPGELERVLAEHPAVADAAVIGIPHADLGEAPAALIELRPSVQASEVLRAELGNLIEIQFAPYKRLSGGVHFVESLPRTDLNKVVRRKLKDLLPNGIF
ncbi:luciferin 4-monooxygenase [Galendromus occidentalis]|uniref:Luciferin 4-monooxygenase n=1 Tax=Galendromus occidentalis TaxID=34638 RepID=A0AAJ6VYJ4_9ACAR|nr:luciferin 4-monooxygenase [Galendromus occidentalis]